MVQLYQQSKNKAEFRPKEYQLNPITSKTFLKTLDEDYPQGVGLTVKSISQIFRDKYSNSPSVYITFEIISNMPNCLAIAVENNHYKQTVDQNGNLCDVYERTDATFQKVSILFKFKEGANENLYFVSQRSKSYPFFLFAMKERGLIPSDYNNHFDLDYEDLQAIIGLDFLAKSKKNNFEGKEYYTLLAERLDRA